MGHPKRSNAEAESGTAQQQRATMARGLSRVRSMRLNQEAQHSARATVAAIRKTKRQG